MKYIKFDGKNKTGKWDRPTSSTAFFEEVLNSNEQDQFVLKIKREQKNNSYTEQYRQFYQGVEVEGGIFILQFKNGKLNKANGHYINTKGIDPSPKLTPADAAESFASYLDYTDISSLKFLHCLIISESEVILGTDTLYNIDLCYKINLLNSPASKGETGYVDAHTGKILKTQKNWFNTSVTGTFTTLYSGTKSAGTQYYNSIYNLIDSSRNAVINTWDLNNTFYDNYADSAVVFTDNDNSWTQQEHSTNEDQMALDIHWALQEIYDYFDENYDLQSFDGVDHMIDAFVHTVFDDNNKDNAMFNVFPSNDQVFFFGDGETTFKPLGALDVVAHEYAHAITHNFTAWATLTTVRRALHEGLSDIWGVTVENAVAPEKQHWRIGEEVINVSGDDCLRNIQYPESPISNTQIADTYENSIYNNGGIYEKSGVMSYWFYLLSESGTGRNDNNNTYTVYGLGLDVAAEIVFDGQTTEFASVSSYADARDAMIDAAEDIFGANSFQSLQVANAWYAVGVGSNPGQVTLSGPDVVCYAGSIFTANNCPSGSTISWTTSSNLSVHSGGTTTNPTIRAKFTTSQGEGWVQVNFTSNGCTTPGPRIEVWVGKPGTFDVSDWDKFSVRSADGGNWYVCTDQAGNEVDLSYYQSYYGCSNFEVKITNLSNTHTYQHFYPTYGVGSLDFPNLQEGFYLIWARGYNCGEWGDWTECELEFVECSLRRLIFSPNPTKGETIVSIGLDEIEKVTASTGQVFDETTEWDIEVYDSAQNLKEKKTKLKGNSTNLQTAGWKEGVYIVRAKYKEEVLTGKLVVKK